MSNSEPNKVVDSNAKQPSVTTGGMSVPNPTPNSNAYFVDEHAIEGVRAGQDSRQQSRCTPPVQGNDKPRAAATENNDAKGA